MTNNIKKSSISIKHIYTPLSEARKLIMERFEDKNLKEKVLAYCHESIPKIITEKPRAVLSNPIATPNFEFEYFLDCALETGLEPLVVEYPDKLVARNSLKYHLCKLRLTDRSKKNPKHVVHSPVDFNVWEGKLLSKVTTKKNKSLVDQHHEFLLAIHPEMKDKIYDFSDWFKKTRGKTDGDYYVAFLSLFVCFGILFENYLINDPSEEKFILAKVLPSFEKVTQLFGVKPLICPLLPLKSEHEVAWHWYDHKHNEVMKKTFI